MDTMQFTYILTEAKFYCNTCKKMITLSTQDLKKDTFTCACGNEYKIPFHYNTTFHNKQLKILK